MGFVSAVAVPASLVLAFLGVNPSQVNSRWSMFSRHYLPMYLTVAGLFVLGVVLSVGLWAQQRRQSREQRGRTSPAAEQDRARPGQDRGHTRLTSKACDGGLPRPNEGGDLLRATLAASASARQPRASSRSTGGLAHMPV